MNRKLIAAAVSAAVIAPVAAQAESSFYARVNTAIDLSDLTDDGTTDVSNVVSRFGFKGNADIGNGMTAHGHYEFGVNSDRESAAGGTKGTTGVDDVRIATVGLSGSFGRVDIGQQWSAYFDTFGTLISPTYTLGYYLYSGVGSGLYRASNTIKYSNSFGPVSMELDVRLNESNEGTDVAEVANGDGIGLGLSFAVTDNITVALAFDSEDVAAVDPFAVGDLSVLKAGRHAVDEAVNNAAKADLDADAATAVTMSDTAIDNDTDIANADKAAAKVVATAAINALRDADKSDLDDALDAEYGITAGSAASDVDRVGIAVKATFGNYWGSIGHQTLEVDDDNDATDIDTSFLWGGGSLGDKTDWMVGYATANDGDDADADDSTQVTWGVYHNLGGGMKLYYEATSVDAGDNDGDRHLLGMRVDF